PSSCLRLPPPPLSPRSPYTTLFRSLLVTRMLLGGVTAAAGPLVASLVGDYFAPAERGRIYGYILAGELAGAGFGFAVTGDVATLSWRAAFVVLALPAFVLAWFIFRLPEPARGGADVLAAPGVKRSRGEPHAGAAQALSTLVLVVVGAGGVVGVLAGGALGDLLLRRGRLTGRILVSAVAATAAAGLFVPAIFARDAATALPYITFAALALSAQNPPL